MSFPELLEAVKGLPRAEKIRLIDELQCDVGESTPEEGMVSRYFPPGAKIAIREPVYAPETAAALLELLEAEKPKA